MPRHSSRGKFPAPYRSWLEYDNAERLTKYGIPFRFEPKEGKIPYVEPATNHIYTPDFYITTKSGSEIIVETKGIWVYEDRYKQLLLRQQHPELDIRFVFTNPNAKTRKGSKTTYSDICDGKGRGKFKDVKWKYAKGLIPEEWFEE